MLGLIVGIFCLSGCSDQSAESTVKTFCDSMKKFDLDGMKKTMVEEVQLMDESMEDSGFSNILLDLCKDNAKQIKYTIVSSKEEEDIATVKVKFQYKDEEPLLTVTIAEYMEKGMALAFSGKEMDESTGETLFAETLKEKMKSVKSKIINETLEITCKKVDGKWKIAQLPEEMLNVLTSNISNWAENMGDELSSESVDEELTGEAEESDEPEEPAETKIDISLGDVAALEEVKMKVSSVSETSELKSEYDKTVAPAGTKFIIFQLDVENITKAPLYFDTDEMLLVDSQGRTFNGYDDAYLSVDDLIDYEELSPNIKKSGSIVYNVPSDATNYCLTVKNENTNEVYQFWAQKK